MNCMIYPGCGSILAKGATLVGTERNLIYLQYVPGSAGFILKDHTTVEPDTLTYTWGFIDK